MASGPTAPPGFMLLGPVAAAGATAATPLLPPRGRALGVVLGAAVALAAWSARLSR